MQIEYRDLKLEKVCTNASTARKKYGEQMAAKIHQRVDEISAANDIETLVQFRIGRCHALVGGRAGQYAMDLVHPKRLIFTTKGDEVQVVRIEEITDYH